jgi:hypothetical protein
MTSAANAMQTRSDLVMRSSSDFSEQAADHSRCLLVR